MKFKVEPKDFFLFCFYCLILLYLCALAIANLFSLLDTGTFYGLLPWIAFSRNYIFFTLGLFFGVLIFIFASVSSYIFDKDKGKGIGLKVTDEKPSDGYARWAKEKEIKEASKVEKVNPSLKEISAAGIPLISKDKEMWVDNGDYHNLVIGSTGSGKTENVVFPMVNLLAKKGESMIITDPKGEIFRKTAKNLEARGYQIIVLNFREPNRGNAWNPLSLPYQYYKEGNIDKSTELLDDVALNILYDPSNKGDSEFWEKGSADYFSGLALGLFKDAKESEVNLNSINYMSTVGEERYATSNYIKEYFNFKGPDSNEYMFASTVINAPSDTKGGLLSTFRQKIRLFSTRENLSEMLSYSDFDMRNIGRQKTAVFMIIHDEKKTYHTLMTIFIKQVYETLIDVAQHSPGGKLQYRTNFILDEFANMPPLKDVDSMVSAARSRDIRFTFIIQNFAQLNDVYGENVAQVIRGNCGNLVYLISTELKALEEISKMCGEVKSKDKDKTASTPLVTVSDLQKLKLGDAIILRLRMSPFKTKYTPNFKINWGEDFPEATYPERSVRPIELFDLKKFVTEEKRKKMMEGGANNPFGMPSQNPFAMAGNPFGPSPMSSNPMGFGGMSSPNANRNPFERDNSSNPMMSSSNPFNSGLSSPSPFGGGMSIDDMMKDIDRKLQELDEEEKRQKEKLKQQNKELMEGNVKESSVINNTTNKINSDLINKNIVDNHVIDDEDDDFEDILNNSYKISNNDEIKETSNIENSSELKREENINNLEEKKTDDSTNTIEKDINLVNNDQQEKPKVNIDVDSVIVNENVITDDEFFDDFFNDD